MPVEHCKVCVVGDGSDGPTRGLRQGQGRSRDESIMVPHSRPARLHTKVAAVFGAFRMGLVILAPRSPEHKG